MRKLSPQPVALLAGDGPGLGDARLVGGAILIGEAFEAFRLDLAAFEQ